MGARRHLGPIDAATKRYFMAYCNKRNLFHDEGLLQLINGCPPVSIDGDNDIVRDWMLVLDDETHKQLNKFQKALGIANKSCTISVLLALNSGRWLSTDRGLEGNTWKWYKLMKSFAASTKEIESILDEGDNNVVTPTLMPQSKEQPVETATPLTGDIVQQTVVATPSTGDIVVTTPSAGDIVVTTPSSGQVTEPLITPLIKGHDSLNKKCNVEEVHHGSQADMSETMSPTEPSTDMPIEMGKRGDQVEIPRKKFKDSKDEKESHKVTEEAESPNNPTGQSQEVTNDSQVTEQAGNGESQKQLEKLPPKRKLPMSSQGTRMRPLAQKKDHPVRPLQPNPVDQMPRVPYLPAGQWPNLIADVQHAAANNQSNAILNRPPVSSTIPFIPPSGALLLNNGLFPLINSNNNAPVVAMIPGGAPIQLDGRLFPLLNLPPGQISFQNMPLTVTDPSSKEIAIQQQLNNEVICTTNDQNKHNNVTLTQQTSTIPDAMASTSTLPNMKTNVIEIIPETEKFVQTKQSDGGGCQYSNENGDINQQVVGDGEQCTVVDNVIKQELEDENGETTEEPPVSWLVTEHPTSNQESSTHWTEPKIEDEMNIKQEEKIMR